MNFLQTKTYFFIFLFLNSFQAVHAQGWEKTYGGNVLEEGMEVQQTNDSGFIIVGNTNSFGSGSRDMYLIKTNSTGDTSWTKTYGGIYEDKGTVSIKL